MGTQLAFRVPKVEDNDDGWGPSSLPDHLTEVPFAPYSKSEKIGKVSDFTPQGANYNKYANRYPANQNVSTVFNFLHNEEEDSFHLVDNKPAPRQRQQRRFQPQNRFQNQRGRDQGREQEGGTKQRQKQKQQRPQFQRYEFQRQTQYTSSVDIKPDWRVVEQVQMPSLQKLHLSVGDPEDILFCGELEYYDKSLDKMTKERKLEKTQRAFRNVTTSDDPIIRRLASEDSARIFLTDTIATTLMCAPRSVYSWDIVITRTGDKVFFDKRDHSPLDFLTVAETATEPLPEDKDNINGVQQLSIEATAVNQNFSQQALVKGGEKYRCGEANPFIADSNEELASVAYRYRKWTIGDDMDCVIRCEVDGVTLSAQNQLQFLTIKALNEFDPKQTFDWRQKLERQRATVLATEMKNNSNKIAKWTAQALLAGSEAVKMGYVSRVHPKDNTNHVVLGTQAYKPKEFAQQVNVNMDNCWGIVRAIVDLVLSQETEAAKYLLVKDPNKPILRLYEVPEDAFETNYVDEPILEGGEEEENVVEEAEDGDE